MVSTTLNFIYHIYIPWLILWSKPQISMGLTYHKLWLYYYDIHVVFSDLSFEEEIGIRFFSHPCPLLLPGYSSTSTGNYPFDIAKDFRILTVLSISLSPTLKRFCGELVIPPLVLLGGWPPPVVLFLQTSYFIRILSLWSGGIGSPPWNSGLFLALVFGTGFTLWNPGLSPCSLLAFLFAGFTLATTGGPTYHQNIADNFFHFSVILTTTGSHRIKIINVIRLVCSSFPIVRLLILLDQCQTTSNFYQKYIIVISSRTIILLPRRRRHIGTTSLLSLLLYGDHLDKWHCDTMYPCIFLSLWRHYTFVSRNYLQQYIISLNISQFLSHSSAICGSQENWHCSGSNKSHQPPHHCHSFTFSLITSMLHLYYVNYTKLLILFDTFILSAIIHSRFDKSTHSLNYSYLPLVPSLEYYSKSWDSRLGYHVCCCSYTSSLIQFTLPYNTQPSYTLCASCFIQSTRALASMYICYQLLPCKLSYSIIRKLVSSTCKVKKRRRSRSNLLSLKNE